MIELFALIASIFPAVQLTPHYHTYKILDKVFPLFTTVQYSEFLRTVAQSPNGAVSVNVVAGVFSDFYKSEDKKFKEGSSIDPVVIELQSTPADIGKHWFSAFGIPKERPLKVIIGSGLAGMTAGITILKKNPNLTLYMFEKENLLGGNSFKASTGINAVGTTAQKEAGILDSIDKLVTDTLASGKGFSDEKLVRKFRS